MRKVTYTIDDVAYFRRIYKDYDANSLLSHIRPFKAVYVLYSTAYNDKTPDRYELFIDGKKANINTLNGYQRGVVLGDCFNHFIGRNPQYDGGYTFEKCEEEIMS